MAPLDLVAIRTQRFETGIFDGGGAEVVSYDGGRLYATNSASEAIDVYALGGGKVGSIDLSGLPDYGGVNSVAAKGGLIAAAIENADAQAAGFIALFDAATLGLIATFPAGAMPDMVAFTPDGSAIVAANEGEPNDDLTSNPVGGVTVIDVNAADPAASTAATYDLSVFDGDRAALEAAGIRMNLPGATVGEDLEPEYIAVDPISGDLLVTLQEANAIAVFDMEARAFTEIRSAGTVDHSVASNGFDASDRDDAIDIRPHDVLGLRMPDAIAAFSVNGETFYATANEGDGRDYDAFGDEGARRGPGPRPDRLSRRRLRCRPRRRSAA